jgi:C2 domain
LTLEIKIQNTMPSTVKVRIKGARNLPGVDGNRPNVAPATASSLLSPSSSAITIITSGTTTNAITTPSARTSATTTTTTPATMTTDFYVTVSLGGHSGLVADYEEQPNLKYTALQEKLYTAKTRVCRHTTNPVWDEEFRMDIADDTLLQDEPLIFKVCTHESLRTAESIGLVYIDLNPLLAQTAREDEYNHSPTSQPRHGIASGIIDGWYPLYDTLGGVRGELGLSVKLNFIGDVNPFRDSAAGVQLYPFSTLDPESGYTISHVFGFVEELVVAEDPEFEWNANFREARTSHESRQTLMYLLDASVRRRMSKKVLEMGGNAVLGYHQNFDVEGDSGIVARTYGTCVLLGRQRPSMLLPRLLPTELPTDSEHEIGPRSGATSGNSALSNAAAAAAAASSSRLLKDSDNSSTSMIQRAGGSNMFALSEAAAAAAQHRESRQGEVALLTVGSFDPSVRVRIGGLVTARCVKYLGNLASKLSDQETRDGWWSELRDEIRSHAKILCCSHVVGYLEASTIVSSSGGSHSFVMPSQRLKELEISISFKLA